MNKNQLALWLLIGFCGFVPASVQAGESYDVLTVSPAAPSAQDLVEINVVLRTTNISFVGSVEREGHVITLELVDLCWGLCGGYTLQEHVIPLGRLEPGTWRIEGTSTFSFITTPLVPLEFEVEPAGGRTVLALEPATPAAGDPLKLRVGYETVPCQTRPRVGAVSRTGNNLRVELELGAVEESCPENATQLGSVLADLGPLAAGEYLVELVAKPADGSSPFPQGSLFFTVGPVNAAELLGRFRATLRWRTPDGQQGVASRVGGSSDESALFSFFSPTNWEVMVKVLDGCAINGHYWVFLAAATDVEYTLTIEDLRGLLPPYTYRSPAGLQTPPLGDTAAFTCAG